MQLKSLFPFYVLLFSFLSIKSNNFSGNFQTIQAFKKDSTILLITGLELTESEILLIDEGGLKHKPFDILPNAKVNKEIANAIKKMQIEAFSKINKSKDKTKDKKKLEKSRDDNVVELEPAIVPTKEHKLPPKQDEIVLNPYLPKSNIPEYSYLPFLLGGLGSLIGWIIIKWKRKE